MAIEGGDRLNRKFQEMERKQPNVHVIVGYKAEYALNVHERVEMKWKGLPRSGEVRFGGYDGAGNRWVTFGHNANSDSKGFFWDPLGKAQSKFLETPAREKRDEIAGIVRTAVKNGATLEKALVLGGLFLQAESQKLVPVDTGKLKASAFTEVKK